MSWLSRKKATPLPNGAGEPTFRGQAEAASPAEHQPAFDDAEASAGDPVSDAPAFPSFSDTIPVLDEPEAPARGRRKRRKESKAAKVKPVIVDDEEFSVPTMVMFDFCQGMTKMTDAEAHARALVEDFTAKTSSWIYCQPWRGGMAIEVQQGGGKAFLPEVLAAFDESEGAVVAVPMSNRVAQVTFNEAGMLETMLLSSEQGPPVGAFRAMPGPQMKPYDQTGARIAALGVACVAASGLAACFAMFGFFADKEAWAAPYLEQAAVETLPIGMQAQQELQRAAAEGDCVLKLEFVGGAWKATTGYNVDGQCMKDPPLEGAAGALSDGATPPDGSIPADPSAIPGAPGVPPVPPVSTVGGV